MKNMYKTLLLIMLLFVFACSEVLSSGGQKLEKAAPQAENQNVAPAINFDEPSHNFGETYQNTKLKHSFKFKNMGTGELIIEKVKAG